MLRSLVKRSGLSLCLPFIEETKRMTPNYLLFVILEEKAWMIETAFGIN